MSGVFFSDEGMMHSICDICPQVASVCLVRVAYDRSAATSFQEEASFLLNDIAHFESDIMPSKGGSILSEGGLVPYDVVILTGGFNILLEGGIMPSEMAERRISGARHFFFLGGLIHLFLRHDTFERAA